MSIDHGLSVMTDNQIRRLLQSMFGLHVKLEVISECRVDLEAKILMKMESE